MILHFAHSSWLMTSEGGVTRAAAAASEATFSPVDCCGEPTSTFPCGVIVTTSSVAVPVPKTFSTPSAVPTSDVPALAYDEAGTISGFSYVAVGPLAPADVDEEVDEDEDDDVEGEDDLLFDEAVSEVHVFVAELPLLLLLLLLSLLLLLLDAVSNTGPTVIGALEDIPLLLPEESMSSAPLT